MNFFINYPNLTFPRFTNQKKLFLSKIGKKGNIYYFFSKKFEQIRKNRVFMQENYSNENYKPLKIFSQNDSLIKNNILKQFNRRTPVVAVVGRGNVGKSTLVNRLAGAFKNGSIVHDMLGITRDKTYRRAYWCDYEYLVTDTGGFVFEGDHEEQFSNEIKEQAMSAIQEANIIIFVVDGQCDLNSNDLELASFLKFQQIPVLLAINKCENLIKYEENKSKFWSLGFGEPIPVSAIHGINTNELLDKVIKFIPKINLPLSDNTIKVALVGKPNVGKSSILNFLTGRKRAIVSKIPGTTRDSSDSFISGGSNCNVYNLIDTAGIRKKKMIDYGPEFFMINRTFKAIQRCDCVLFVIDSSNGVTEQDQKLSERIQEQGKACVILFNKWDKMSLEEKNNIENLKSSIKRTLPSVSWADILLTSALDGTSCNKIFQAVDLAVAQYKRHVTTSICNEIIQEAIRWRAPPFLKTGKQGKIFYCTQISEKPPTIAVFVNEPSLFTEAYRKYIESQFRIALGFEGTSLRILWTNRR